MTRGRALALVLSVALVGAAVGTSALVVSRSQASATPMSEVRSAVRVGRTAPGERITFDFVLRIPRRAAFDAYARDVDTPGSPHYRQFLSAPEIGVRFGLSDAALARLDTGLARHHLEVVERYPERTALRVAGSARSVESALGVVLDDYRDTTSRARFHRPRHAPRLPRWLATAVRGVSGLDSQPPALVGLADRTRAAVPVSAPAAGTIEVPPDALTPTLLARAFDIEPLRAAGIDGSGQSVAILAISDFDDADLPLWDQATGTTGAPPVRHVRVGTGSLSEDELEAALDVEVVRAVAPQARISLFSVSPGSPTFMADALREVLRDGQATIVSASFSACDAARSFEAQHWDRESSRAAVQAARVAGLNMVFSSGDNGAYICRHKYALDDLAATVAFPADTGFVTAVGGTSLARAADGTYVEEAGWEDPLSLGGGGGGVSPTEPRPAWQRGPGVANEQSDGHRQIPDVAAPGDPWGGYFIVWNDAGTRQGGVCAGTSAATPFWGGLLALFQQMSANAGIPRLGFVNPMLYAIAASDAPNTVFHDVVRGGNLLYDAAPGWDYSTGLGTPIAAALGNAMVDYLREHGPST
ncbi:MAG TPA: S53 family serine peptidase [Acidimicrobiia bacterium]|nr:S53 family serine peptidase [Acidimicrobiia bacterium]